MSPSLHDFQFKQCVCDVWRLNPILKEESWDTELGVTGVQ